MPAGNAYQVADWNGRSGEAWVANQQRLDRMLAEFGDAALEAAAPSPGEVVVDIGCGAGASSFALLRHVGQQGRVLGLDISEPLVIRAREDAESLGRISFEVADAATAALPHGEVDLLFSRFGVMFFEDPVSAFAHLRSALKPEGRLAFVCWREAAENDWVRLPMTAIRNFIPPVAPPDPEAPGPFSLGDRSRVERILAQAGFEAVTITPFDREIVFGEGLSREAAIDDAVGMSCEVGPLSRVLADQDEKVRTEVLEAVRAAFAARVRENCVVIDGAAWIVSARR